MQEYTIYKPPFQKLRLGNPDEDGGYVICDLGGQYDCFISGGLGGDMGFEVDFLRQYSNIKQCFAHDGTVDYLPEARGIWDWDKQLVENKQQIVWIDKNLSAENTDHPPATNLREWLDQYKDIFLKLDIEGGEYPLFSSFSKQDLIKFKQIVLETHNHEDKSIVSRLCETHWLVHIHGNNHEPIAEVDGVRVPACCELTYIRKETCSNLPKNTIPIGKADQDVPNCNRFPEIVLDGYPYCQERNNK